MNEVRAAETVIYQRLTATAAVTAICGTRLYAGIVPQGSAYPLVLWSYNSGLDRMAVGASVRLLSRPLFVVRAVSKSGSWVIADQLASAVDAALVGYGASVTIDGTVYRVDCAGREQPVRTVEVDGDTEYRYSGGMYRWIVSGSIVVPGP